MDREDVVYATAIVLVGLGAGLFHPGAGLLCAGLMVGFPFLVKIVTGNGPPKEL